MAKTPPDYVKLARGTANFAVRGSVWRGKDHMLYVTFTGYTETYRRFYFSDIQAFIIRKTRRFFFENLIMLGLAFVSGMGAMISYSQTNSSAFVPIGFSAMGVFLLILLINAAFGPTCKFHVQTAVGLEEISPIRRIRRARKVVAALRPYVEISQSTAMPDRQTPESGIADAAAGGEPESQLDTDSEIPRGDELPQSTGS